MSRGRLILMNFIGIIVVLALIIGGDTIIFKNLIMYPQTMQKCPATFIQ